MMEQQGGGGMGERKVCKCPHHKIVPWLIIIAGLSVVYAAFKPEAWMLATIIIGVLLVVKGVMKLNSHKCTCCDTPWR